ncbi:hypothetical protein [uncultured Pseudomonas sp.]|uniref:hypothetical protein n=1 Tax=uncultured Pseudomonas sp. TaxID=114707 RepID=UPI0025F81500|nr:hypothetical protein [uncultured Pseudomonas sp.]
MTDRFLLYIDILGFTEMVQAEPRKVARIYSILNTLNAHRHESFKTIVFSDTILVYNIEVAGSDADKEYLVMYLIEFADDLHHRLTGQDIYFRATLVAGDFSHYPLKHVECFYGTALITAHNAEKEIPALGLFIDKECLKYNRFFRCAPFNSKYSFVYLSQSIEKLNVYANGQFPVRDYQVHMGDIAPFITWQVRFLQDIHRQMREHQVPSVRAKYLAAWDFYKQRYPQMLKVLEDNKFDSASLGGAPDWDELRKLMERDVSFYKRIGSGTDLSMSITNPEGFKSKYPKKPRYSVKL